MSEIISFLEAKDKGLTEYFNGLPCRNNHVSPRSVATGACIACRRAATARHQQKDPIRFREKATAWQRANPEKTKEIRRQSALKQLYGLSLDEFSDLIKQQNNCCPLCQEEFIKTPDVDHDHTTGKVRGLLCRSCNLMLGKARDSISVLSRAIDYLTNSL